MNKKTLSKIYVLILSAAIILVSIFYFADSQSLKAISLNSLLMINIIILIVCLFVFVMLNLIISLLIENKSDDASKKDKDSNIPKHHKRRAAQSTDIKTKKKTEHDNVEASGKSLILLSIIWSLCIIGIILISYTTFIGFVNMKLNSENFYDGIMVNDIDVSTMTYQEALTISEDEIDDKFDSFSIKVYVDDTALVLTNDDLKIQSDLVKRLDEAYAYGRSGEWKERIKDLYETQNNKNVFDIDYSYDIEVLEILAQNICDLVADKPIDAAYEFSPNVEGSFIITQDKPGKYLDIEMVLDKLIQACNTFDSSDIKFISEIVDPEITFKMIEDKISLLAEKTTDLNENPDRSANIALAGEAVEGIIAPGEMFSFNLIVGERTRSKGYKNAPAIADGSTLVDAVGGGICQVTSTIYSSILKTNMEIVERYNHSIRISYLPPGEDATVDFNTNKDLKFINNTGENLYIVCSVDMDANTFNVKLYGYDPEPDVNILVRTEILEYYAKKVKTSFSDAYKTGKIIVVSKGASGRKTQTYRDYYKNDALIESILMSKDTYSSTTRVLIYGSG